MIKQHVNRRREREREREIWAYVRVVGIIVETAEENSSSSKLCIFSSLAIIDDPGYKYS